MVPPVTRISCSATAATSSTGPSPAVRERIDSRASSGVESSMSLRFSLAIASRRLCACGSSGIMLSPPTIAFGHRSAATVVGGRHQGPIIRDGPAFPLPLKQHGLRILDPEPVGGILREASSVLGAVAAALLPLSERDGWPARRAAGETAAESTPPDAAPAAPPRGVAAPEAAATVSPASSRLDVTTAAWREREPPRSVAQAP